MSADEIKAKVLGWLERANTAQVGAMLLAIYDRQTVSEQASETTNHNNGMGFNGTDAAFGSRLAKWYGAKHTSDRQTVPGSPEDASQVLEATLASSRG
jgi:hypothetical protein